MPSVSPLNEYLEKYGHLEADWKEDAWPTTW
jgi:hypothetical protein